MIMGARECDSFCSSVRVQSLMERVLFVWSIRHPACGYVQGINDLLTPFLVVFALETGALTTGTGGAGGT